MHMTDFSMFVLAGMRGVKRGGVLIHSAKYWSWRVFFLVSGKGFTAPPFLLAQAWLGAVEMYGLRSSVSTEVN